MVSEVYTITFLRQGESVGNLENRFQGHANFPLTETGHAQARLLAERWKAEGRLFDRVFSSPPARARETAEIVCAALNVLLEFDPDWMEINNGLIAGLNHEEAAQVAARRPNFMTPYPRCGETGESRWGLCLRAGRAIHRLLEQLAGSYLVTAHGGILNMIIFAILGIPVQPDFFGPRFMFYNASSDTFTFEPEGHIWRMLHFVGQPHSKED